MQFRQNLLKARLTAGGVAIGTSLHEARDPGVVYALAAAGADAVFIDLEHHPQSIQTATDLVAFAHAAGITPLVRVPQLDQAWVTRLLDAGCQSLLVPRVRTRSEVERLLELAQYHPLGRRGMSMYGGAAASYHEVTDVAEVTAWQNDNLLLGLVIETPEAVDALDEILVPGIGFAIVGYQDLSHAYGLMGQIRHPRIQDAQARVRELCRERGIAYTMYPTRCEDVGIALDEGAQLILYAGVLTLLRRAMREAVDIVAAARNAGDE